VHKSYLVPFDLCRQARPYRGIIRFEVKREHEVPVLIFFNAHAAHTRLPQEPVGMAPLQFPQFLFGGHEYRGLRS